MEQAAVVPRDGGAQDRHQRPRRVRGRAAGAAVPRRRAPRGGAVGLVTLASVLLFGWLLVISGIMHSVHAFRVHPWGGFTRHLLGGVLSLVVGLLIVANPAAGALSLTLLLAEFFMVGGIFRIVAAVSFRFPGRGWAVLGGLVTLILGIMIWSEWPVSGVWVIGTFVGIDLIFDGWSLVMTGMAARQLPG